MMSRTISREPWSGMSAVKGEEPVLVLAEPVVQPEEVGHAAAQDAREPEDWSTVKAALKFS